MNMKLRKGDKVVVIAGKSKGESGAIVRVFRRENRVLLDGINLVKRHRRATRQGGKGQIIDMPMPIHASNVMIVDPKKKTIEHRHFFDIVEYLQPGDLLVWNNSTTYCCMMNL